MLITRRRLVGSLAVFIAAPAIVRATSLMPVRPWIDMSATNGVLDEYGLRAWAEWAKAHSVPPFKDGHVMMMPPRTYLELRRQVVHRVG